MSELRAEIAHLLAAGVSNRAIAYQLGVAPPTVDYHVRKLAEPSPPAVALPPSEPARAQVRTRARVAEMLEAGLPKVEIAQRLGVSKATVSYHAKRLGAPVDERCGRRYDWSAVQRYYNTGRTVEECVAAFGFSKAAWHSAKQRGDIVTRPKRLAIEELCVEGTPRGRFYLRRRLIEAGLKEERCERCRRTEWLGGPMPLALHHVNGDRNDNRLANLQMLCPNCHAQTDTFAGRKRAA